MFATGGIVLVFCSTVSTPEVLEKKEGCELAKRSTVARVKCRSSVFFHNNSPHPSLKPQTEGRFYSHLWENNQMKHARYSNGCHGTQILPVALIHLLVHISEVKLY